MNLSIKNNIINNIKNDNGSNIIDMIENATHDKDETLLPGLGVLFGLFWEECNKNEKSETALKIKKNLGKY